MDLMPPEQTTQPPSASRLLGGARSGAHPAYLRTSRGVSTPLPQRPRLFTRASVVRRPPARLEPISSPTPTTCLPVQQQLMPEKDHHRCTSNSFHDEAGGLSGASSAVCGEPAGARPSLAVSLPPYEASLLPMGGGMLRACTTKLESAPLPAHVESPPRRERGLAVASRALAIKGYSVAMTADGSGSLATGATESSSAVRSTAAAPRMHAVGSGKRHRMVSSADTQHSSASSVLAPPRSRGAFSHGSAGVESAVPHDDSLGAPTTHALPTSVANDLPEHHELEPDGAPQHYSRSSSRGAVSYSASSIHAGDAGVSGKVGGIAPLGSQSASSDDAADTQCLILEDSVDTATVVTSAQLLQLRADAALGRVHRCAADEPPTSYQRRLVTADVLRDWTGWEDLELVLTAQLRVDAEAMIGVDQIGAHLPSLSSLKLHNSRISRVRQLGTGFHALKYLWLNRCHVTDLHGIAVCCPSLVDLYLPFNHVRDVAPVMALSETLEVLDVEGNLLEDAAELGTVLASLQGVRALSLLGNPLTCQHQVRVRDAYRDLLAEEGLGASASTAASVDVLSSGPTEREHTPFSQVLAAWVRLLMPQLQTLNDVAADVAVSSSCTSPPTRGFLSEEASRRLAAPTTAHVDPLDDALAEELRLVEECVRDTDAFDSLLAAVEEANQHVYTRPSTSHNGAQRRLVPTTAMGVARPFTSLWSRAPVRLGSSGRSMSNASALTTGTVIAGTVTVGLRRRLATSSAAPVDAAQEGLLGTAAVGPTGSTDSSVLLSDICGSNSRSCAAATTDLDEDARIAALLSNDSEEEEWERFKASLLRSQSAQAAAMPRLDASTSTMAAAPSHHQLLHTENEEAAATAEALQADDFDKELRTELTRLRMRIAKEGR
ncbi:hypothetical protein LSCM4_06436 [Leishmania orientalis]|uniref:Leucine-rich repeat protein n=1 Tax=Leishmania orientalis TaxID=2249476 RepID=A0A836HQM6_9TRYP|nr:hypothetical protein LSCM4_06436 [Leishmania orientalis]